MAESSVTSKPRVGSVRGVDGGVEQILRVFRQKTERLNNSPVLRKIREVGS